MHTHDKVWQTAFQGGQPVNEQEPPTDELEQHSASSVENAFVHHAQLTYLPTYPASQPMLLLLLNNLMNVLPHHLFGSVHRTSHNP